MFIKIILLILILAIIYYLLYISINIKFQESFDKVFPENEAKFYRSLYKTYGISQCKYQGFTPILTCSYNSKV
jgi:hypothetical protein